MIKYKYSVLFICLFASIVTQAKIYNGDSTISGHVAIFNNKKAFFETKTEIYSEDGVEYRSEKKNNWKVVLKTKDGKILDSFYIILKRIGPPISSSSSSDKAGKVTNSDYVEYAAHFYFLYVPEAYKVEYYYKDSLKGTNLVMPPK